MPWYEPSSIAPRYFCRRLVIGDSAHSGDEEEWGDGNNIRSNESRDFNEQQVSLQDYLDLNWNASNGDGSHNEQRGGANFDGFQHRVERQLGAAVVPSVAASASFAAGTLNPSLYRSANINLQGGGPISKTAQFFHPRQVLALRQYEGFFSPLEANASGRQPQQSDWSENAPFNNQRDNCDNMQSSVSSWNQQPQILPEPRNLFVQHSATEIAASANHHHDEKSPFKTNKKLASVQSTLRQDPITKRMIMATTTAQYESSKVDEGGRKLLSSWENYSGRSIDDNFGGRSLKHSNRVNEQSQKQQQKLQKKTKKDERNNSKKGKSSSGGGGYNEQRIDSIFPLKSGGDYRLTHVDNGDGSCEGDNVRKKKSKKKKMKYPLPLDSLCELALPTNHQGHNIINNMLQSSTAATVTATLSQQDFEGMTDIMNAAQCMEGLQHFLSRVGEETFVAWTMIFLDPLCHFSQHREHDSSLIGGGGGGGGGKRRKRDKKFALISNAASLLECSTPFLPSNKRYCTDKGPTCTAWNCTCDDQIRAMRGCAPLLGAMFVLNKVDDDCVSESVGEGGGGGGCGGKECYLLPLGPTENCLHLVEAGYSRMKSWPVIPFDCGVSLSDRWSAFEAIMSKNDRRTKMVTYNATIALMPFYHHQCHDETSGNGGGESQTSQIRSMLPSSQFSAYLTGSQDDKYNHFERPAHLNSIWDLRLVSWMLRPDVNEEQLEWSTFKSGFAHLAPDVTLISNDDMPVISQGLMEARADLALLHSLFPLINQQLIRKDLLRALENIEAPLQSILTCMECRGVGFYPQRLKRVESQLSARIEELEAQSRAVTKDSDFLLSSPQQVSQYLFDTLKLNVPDGVVSKTKSSHRSTSEEALKAIKSDAVARMGSAPEILDIILEFRTLSKLLTTYIRPLPRLCIRGEGKSKKTPSRIHPQWMMTAVRTGRLSCRKPNLQQLPSDSVFGIKPRDAIVPSAKEGMCLFACDYSQKEVRILAQMSNDKALLSLFRADANTDIYKQMASVIRNKPAESVTAEERAQFKQVTLAILYGMSSNQVATKLSISKNSAQQTMDEFFKRFRRVKSWMEETKEVARLNGYVLTISGRRRYLNDIRSSDNFKRSQAERQAINTVIQGSAADLMKAAMIQLSERLQSWQEVAVGEDSISPRPRMVLQIHDEVLLELRFNEGDIKRLQAIALKSCCHDCEELFNLKVPLLIKCSCGLSFGSMKEI